MRHRIFNAVVVAAALLAGSLAMSVCAQQSSSNGDKTTPSQSNAANPPASSPTPPADDNAFPADQSKQAEKDAHSPTSGNTPPDAAAPQPATSDGAAGQDNAFPEETSRKAEVNAKADAKAAANAPVSSGVSSSSDYDTRANGGRNAVTPNVSMSHIHGKDSLKEDVQVGTYYLQAGDYPGAYARFKEASTLHPESTDAIFGLAEAARHLNKKEEALVNYKLFLDIVPAGSKAKDARKALVSLTKAN